MECLERIVAKSLTSKLHARWFSKTDWEEILNQKYKSEKESKNTDLSMFSKFHHNPDWSGVRTYTYQLDNVWMVKLLHNVYKRKKIILFKK